MAHSRLVRWLLAIVTVVLIWSAVHPHDYFTWLLEVAPVLIGVPVLAVWRKRLPFTPLVYVLIAIHMIILMIGGHYTYARVPLFDWLRDTFGLARNHYDRLGHFAQGFVPAMIAREVLLRTTALVRGKMLVFLILSIALAISGAYELIEWAGAELFGSASDDFLGTQGDPWDTQKDMALALIGAATALATLSVWHDRQLGARVDKR